MSDPQNSSAAVAGKSALRAQIRLTRARIDDHERQRQAHSRDAALVSHRIFVGVRTVGLFVSVGHEPDTSGLRATCRTRGLTVLLPILAADGTLSFADDVAPLHPGRRGLREPRGPAKPLADADLVVVPALAVDRSGHRLGQGGGSYDRVLGSLRGRVPLIALLHPGELLDVVPVEAHDVPVDGAALPGEVVLFGFPAADQDDGQAPSARGLAPAPGVSAR